MWTAAQDVTLNLAGLHHAAQRRGDSDAALEWLERALAVVRELRLEELCGMAGSLQLMRAEFLCQEGRIDEAMEDLTCFVDRRLSQWAQCSRGDPIRSGIYDKLDIQASGISAAYLAQNLRMMLEQGEASEQLKDREDFQSLLARLAEIEGA